jgi:hypothetical protein
MCIFSLQLVSEAFLILRINEQHMIKMCIGLHVKYLYSCPILIKLEFSRQIFGKPSNMKLHENPSSGSRVAPCGRTDMIKLTVARKVCGPNRYSILTSGTATHKYYVALPCPSLLIDFSVYYKIKTLTCCV